MRKIENLNVLPPVSPPPFFEWPLLATHCGILHQIKSPGKKGKALNFPSPVKENGKSPSHYYFFIPVLKSRIRNALFRDYPSFVRSAPKRNDRPSSLSFPMHLAVGARGRREFNSIRGFYDRKGAEEEGRTLVACVRP